MFKLDIKLAKKENVSAAEKMLGDFAPRLLGYTGNVLFRDVWEDKELSRRERSLITVAALVAGEVFQPTQISLK